MKNTYLITVVSFLIVVLVFSRDFSFNLNNKLSFNDNSSPSVLAVSVVSIDNIDGLAAIFSANSKDIKWISNNFSGNTGVNINLLRKISGDPIEYELVRTIVKNTPNDGSYLWTPREGEINSGLYIEVSCPQYSSTKCTVSGNPLEVISDR
jgi:hypothetical protein